MTRTDAHRPSAIQPDEYEFVGYENINIAPGDLGSLQWLIEERARIRAHMASTGGTYSRHAHGGNCMVCGNANAIYTILFYHAKTNSYVRVGSTCAEKMERGDILAGLNAFVARFADARAAKAGKAKAEATLADLGLSAAWAIYTNPNGNPEAWRQRDIAIDLVAKLVQYGSLSDKQVAFLRSLLDQIAKAPAIAAQRKVEHDAAAPAPTGRVTFEGEVLSVQTRDGYNGEPVRKMLVRADAGWKVWVTMPSAAGAERGDRIHLTATLEPSKDDPKFAFGKRPHLISVAAPASA